MLRFKEKKLTKQTLYAVKKPIKIWDVNVDNIDISKLARTKTNSKYLIGYLDEFVRPLLKCLKLVDIFKTFKVEVGDKNKNNKLISFPIDDEKLLENYKAIWNKIEDLKYTELNALPVYDDRYMVKQK